MSHVVVYMPTHFPYESTKVVPWKYDITVVDKEREEVECEKSLEIIDIDVTNIAGTGRMTRSSHIYTP